MNVASLESFETSLREAYHPEATANGKSSNSHKGSTDYSFAGSALKLEISRSIRFISRIAPARCLFAFHAHDVVSNVPSRAPIASTQNNKTESDPVHLKLK